MKNVIITGASEGLGRTIATYLTKKKYNVIIISPSEKKLKLAAKEIGCDYVVCDVSDSTQVKLAINKIVKKYKTIDVLVNNAGLWIQGPLDENDYERISSVVDVNLKGVINVSKAIIPTMKEQKQGVIININSQAGINYKAERVVYNATKWGVTGFTKSLQPEVAKYGIKVTDIMPGKMKTNMFENLGIHKDMKDGLDTIEVAKAIEFIIKLPKDVTIPELGIKNINN